MTVRLELPPAIEAELQAKAKASGLTVEAYALRLLSQNVSPPIISETPSSESTPEERARAFEAWARSHPVAAPLPPEAFERRTMIRDAE